KAKDLNLSLVPLLIFHKQICANYLFFLSLPTSSPISNRLSSLLDDSFDTGDTHAKLRRMEVPPFLISCLHGMKAKISAPVKRLIFMGSHIISFRLRICHEL